ncbi:hypothetical protein RhiirB3_450383 [Rhizophagus irregularis]|nr:hypothetical protein RhiirB3_450383 [Rhizophagus irregularis]
MPTEILDYLLAFEKQLIPENWLNLYNERLVKDKEVGNGKYVSEEKLVQTLFIKKNYVVHYRAFQTYIQDEGDLFLIKNETKGDPIGESVCLKPKMYSVLPAGHNPKTPNDPDSEDPKKKHECLRNKKLTWHDMYGLCSYDYQIYLERRIELYKRLIASEIFPKEAEERTMKFFYRYSRNITKMVDHKDIELAQVKVIKTALRKGKKYDNLAKNYGDYLKKLRAEKNLNDYIKTVAIKMFSNKEAYTLKLENYRKRYADNDLYASLKELYELYYYIAKEENHERLNDEIEQMLRAMSI